MKFFLRLKSQPSVAVHPEHSRFLRSPLAGQNPSDFVLAMTWKGKGKMGGEGQD
ncbi:MAG: hypothetical protein ACAH59_09635 [Pseudobdellovibrionaceae bacterium]